MNLEYAATCNLSGSTNPRKNKDDSTDDLDAFGGWQEIVVGKSQAGLDVEFWPETVHLQLGIWTI